MAIADAQFAERHTGAPGVSMVSTSKTSSGLLSVLTIKFGNKPKSGIAGCHGIRRGALGFNLLASVAAATDAVLRCHL
ncbi:MAG TPA: hypothetical protein VJ783_20220, partial [Pirellulales bacterium]|nr:hypothetical protein [Pirellulales bacterium]